MPRGRALQELKLTRERERLLEWTRRHKSAQALALRSRIVLAAAEGHANREVARQLRVTGQTVGKWRSRFLKLRLTGTLCQELPDRAFSTTWFEGCKQRVAHPVAPRQPSRRSLYATTGHHRAARYLS